MAVNVNLNQKENKGDSCHILYGGGEMGKLICEFDWSKTSLGPLATWPQSLRTTLSIIIHSKFPMFLFWGPELICFYNDAYRSSLGNDGKHPGALGKAGEKVWPETWHIIKPLIDQVLSGGEATWSEDQLIPIYRNGKLEDVYWTFSYSPVMDESGKPGGVFVTCSETTQKVKGFKKLEENEELLRIALEGGELGTFDFYPQTEKLVWSAKTKQLFGLPPEAELDYTMYLKGLHPDDKERSDITIKNAMRPENGGLYENEYRAVGFTDGKLRWVRSKGKIRFDRDGKPLRFTGITQDITERKQIEEEKQKLIALIEASTDYVGLADLNGKARYVNPAGLNIVGWDNYEGRYILDNIYPEDRFLAEKVLLPKLLKEGHFSHEIRFWNEKTNEPVWMMWNGFSIKDPATDEIIALATISPNISERKQAEQTLKESEERFHNLADTAPIFMAMADETGNAVYFNKPWLEWTGRTMEDLHGLGWLCTLHPEDAPKFEHDFKNAFYKQITINEQYRFRRADGEYRWMLAVGAPRITPDGKFVGYFGTYTDFHELKQAQDALKESEARFRRISDSNIIGIAFWNTQGFVTDANQAFLEMLGFTYEDMLEGKVGWNEQTLPAFRPLHAINVPRAIQGEPIEPYEIQMYRKDNRVVDVLVGYAMLENSQTEGLAYLLDITERKRAEESYKIKNEQLIRINNDLDNFIYTASHDLKAPVNNIEGLVNVLHKSINEDSKNNPKVKHLLELIQNSIERFKNTIRDLTEIAKIQGDGEDLSEVSLAEMLEEVKLNIKSEIDESKTVITADFSQAPVIYFSRKNVRSILYNLVSNAIKYSSPHRPIKISVTSSYYNSTHILLSVQDNGLGIKEEDKSKVFTMFKRLHDHVEGTGIGLSIVKKIIDNNGGKIEIESELGKGTLFKIYFKI